MQQLMDQGYTVHTSGPGFAAVSQCWSAGDTATTTTSGSSSTTTTTTDAAAASAPQQRPAERRSLLEAAGRAVAAAHQGLQRRRHLRALSALGGVSSVESDPLRYLNRPAPSAVGGSDGRRLEHRKQPPSAAARLTQLARRVLRSVFGAATLTGHWSAAGQAAPGTPFSAWELDQTSCSLKDEVTAGYAGAEVVPWGIRAIEADSTKVPTKTAGSGVTVCIIDSGVWADHPDLKGNGLSGCGVAAGGAASGASAGDAAACPFPWDGDLISHGTHVAGTIAAVRNGAGVVGVIPGGADLYVVRVWNTSGDVSQGQGLYASDLVRAYAACEARLDQLQALKPGQKQRMVVSLSYGSAGPLTVERLWFERAAARKDMLFTARCGGGAWGARGDGGCRWWVWG